jgi:hypothetical protein
LTACGLPLLPRPSFHDRSVPESRMWVDCFTKV